MKRYVGEIVYEDMSMCKPSVWLLDEWVAEGIYCCRERIDKKILKTTNHFMTQEVLELIAVCLVDYLQEVKNIRYRPSELKEIIFLLYLDYDEGIWCKAHTNDDDPTKYSYLGKGIWEGEKPRRIDS